MSDYPAHLERVRTLRDGRRVTIRPVRHEDDLAEMQFLRELSGEARYLRFQKWVNEPSEKLIRFLTDVDYRRHMAYVCTTDDGAGAERIVGEARYVTNPDGVSCEFGVMIADDWHRTGIGGLLMEALLRTAADNGLTSMEGFVLAQNSAMLRFSRALGFRRETCPEDRTLVRVVKALAPSSGEVSPPGAG